MHEEVRLANVTDRPEYAKNIRVLRGQVIGQVDAVEIQMRRAWTKVKEGRAGREHERQMAHQDAIIANDNTKSDCCKSNEMSKLPRPGQDEPKKRQGERLPGRRDAGAQGINVDV
jgi:hypothetical protein